jgi:hypothetical protein
MDNRLAVNLFSSIDFRLVLQLQVFVKIDVFMLYIIPLKVIHYKNRYNMEDKPQTREVRVNTAGFTPLLYAVVNNHPSIVQVLIDSKAGVNNTDNSGNTPLIVASYMGFYDIVTILIKAGADLYIQNKNGTTALIAASQTGEVPIWDFPESVCEKLDDSV